ncbi:antiviral reverse transcriptase Drt3a [Serratia liquefaciens]|uniref:antiviral reverse transcriptase Drt3a n=1 Tax=Serratia liquefaciens TaxID=614 RepID=UPI00381470A6
MNRQAFTSYILEKNLLPREKFHLKSKYGANAFEQLSQSALLIAHENFRAGVKVKVFPLQGKAVYSTSCLREKIILRHCASNLHQAMGLNLKQRNAIIDEVKIYLSEGSKFKTYRLDIKSFFESIDFELLMRDIEGNINISRHTRSLVEWYLKGCKNKHQNSGLPRGLEISPVLSEIYLIEFDNFIKTHVDVLYYSRFVDDILLITTANEDEREFINFINTSLPEGLEINNAKDKKSISPIITKRKQGSKPDGTDLHSFNFLGYQIRIINTHVAKGNYKAAFRSIKIGFSEKRLKKFKTRISRAFYAYNNNNDYKILVDRIKFLTSNREIKRQVKGQNKIIKRKISTGIFYSNSKLDPDSPHLDELDKFLFFCIQNTKSRLNNGRKVSFTNTQKRELLKNSFKSGFIKRTHISFNYKRCTEIMKIWL